MTIASLWCRGRWHVICCIVHVNLAGISLDHLQRSGSCGGGEVVVRRRPPSPTVPMHVHGYWLFHDHGLTCCVGWHHWKHVGLHTWPSERPWPGLFRRPAAAALAQRLHKQLSNSQNMYTEEDDVGCPWTSVRKRFVVIVCEIHLQRVTGINVNRNQPRVDAQVHVCMIGCS